MRTETVSKTFYQFDELSDQAKERAREWYREGALDYDWYDSVYDDAARIFDILGIDSKKPVKLMNGTTRYEPAIWFTGFSSQGDGACFEGTYSYKRGCVRALKRYAPKDEELHRITRELAEVQRRHGYSITASLRHRGNYYHAHTVEIDVDWHNESYVNQSDDAETVRELLRDLMHWIYVTLEKEHDYLLSDECVDDTIRANEYEFTEEGERA